MFIPLQTSRLLLRPFQVSDLEPFLAYRNDPLVYRYQGWKTPYLREDALDFLIGLKENAAGTPGTWFQVAIERTDVSLIEGPVQTMIGDVAFHVTKFNPRMAYLGYSLASSAWGHGYASEAVSKILDYLFRILDLHRVMADCDVDNAASIRLLERLHFRREAHYIESFWLENECSWGSEYLYAILQREWRL